MKNLKRKDLDTFEWLFPVPGDWHFIKTVSEVLKSVLWDGGFHDIAANCGMKKEVSKWKDIHQILIALLEALMRASLKDCHDTNLFDISEEFQDWGKFEIYVQELCKGKNEVS